MWRKNFKQLAFVNRVNRPTKLLQVPESTASSAGREAVMAQTQEENQPIPDRLSPCLSENQQHLQQAFQTTADVVLYEFTLFDNRTGLLVYVEGLIDSHHLASDVLQRLTKSKREGDEAPQQLFNIERLALEFITLAERKWASTLMEVEELVVDGLAVLLVDGETTALGLSAASRRGRSITEPDTETLIRGPREGFIENIGTNISLVRRRLPTTEFKIESMKIGRYTKTEVALCYLDDLANPAIVDEMRRRLKRIDIDGVIDAGYLEELVEDSPFSPFPQVQNSERPDVVVASLLEGKVAVLTDGSPFALIAPINLWAALQAAEDYYERYMIVSLIRWLRYLFLILALFLPSLYVAITTFHQEMLPTKLLLSVAAAREVTPLPAVVEALLMEITFEALREAGVRLPKAVGSAISIVGALVIGQAAVQAGMASAPMVIIVSITGVASFTIPRYNFAIAIRMLRFPMILLAGTLGLFGIVIGFIGITIHLSQLRSFGIPYLYPLSPFSSVGLKDTLLRVPRWAMGLRPLQLSKANVRRQGPNMKPHRRIPESGPS